MLGKERSVILASLNNSKEVNNGRKHFDAPAHCRCNFLPQNTNEYVSTDIPILKNVELCLGFSEIEICEVSCT